MEQGWKGKWWHYFCELCQVEASVCSSGKQEQKPPPGTRTSRGQNELLCVKNTYKCKLLLAPSRMFTPRWKKRQLAPEKTINVTLLGGKKSVFEYNYFYTCLGNLYPVSRGLKMRKGDTFMLKMVAKIKPIKFFTSCSLKIFNQTCSSFFSFIVHLGRKFSTLAFYMNSYQ